MIVQFEGVKRTLTFAFGKQPTVEVDPEDFVALLGNSSEHIYVDDDIDMRFGFRCQPQHL